MILEIPDGLLERVHNQGELTYPEEAAGLLLGLVDGDHRRVVAIRPLSNSREGAARRNRYLLTPQDMLLGEQEAAERDLDVIGVFHSHPDHPAEPSDFDREWALPWFSYLITRVQAGHAAESRSWRLSDDRAAFVEEQVLTVRADAEEERRLAEKPARPDT